jgi:Zn-dependent protease with chaperone function
MAWLTHDAIWAALASIVAFGLLAPLVARRSAPVPATWLLSLGGAIVAGYGLVVLAAMSAPVVGADDMLVNREHWSGRILAKDRPTGLLVAVIALALLVALLSRTTIEAVRLRRALGHARKLCRGYATELIVLPQDEAEAYAVAGRPGRIVVSRGLLRRLGPAERLVVLEHERAHLRRRHHRHALTALLAAAANPCLAAMPGALGLAIERWADEEAAAMCGRAATASALSKVAELTTGTSRPLVALAAARTAVSTRLSALRCERPVRGKVWLGALVVVLIVGVVSSVLAADRTLTIFQLASRH